MNRLVARPHRRKASVPSALFGMAFLALAPATAAGDAPPLPASQAQMETVFTQFFTVGLDIERPLKVQNLRLEKDALELTFKDGTVYLASPVAGEITGAYFVGTGTMKVTPPNRLEQKSLKREYGKETFEEPFTEAILRFDDGTEKLLQAAGKPAPPGGKEAASAWASRSRVEYNSDDAQLDFLESRLNGLAGRNFFTADINTSSQKWVSFTSRDRNRIEIALFHQRPSGSVGKRLYETWCSFHKRSDYDAKGNYTLMPEADTKDPVALRNVEMTVEIPNTKSVLIDARLQVEALTDGVRLVRFNFINNFDAASWEEKGRAVSLNLVADASGAPLPYLHKWHQLLVLLPRPLVRSEKAEIRIKAVEDTIIQLTPESYWIYTDYPWFPQIGHNGGRYTFDWTVKIAKPMKAGGSGDLVREWQEEKMNCAEWRSDSPVQFPSFVFGDFKTTDGVYRRESPGTGELPLRLFAIGSGSAAVHVKEENILFNVQQGLKSYESIFGPFPYKSLDVAEMANQISFSQSPPGLMLLNWVIGEGGGGGVADQTVFHELAHQWWGHQVGWVGPEDDWISESWSEYASGLMTQGIDKAKFRDQLKAWKRGAVQADAKGTLSTAYRSEERTNLLYAKGPYVVHMLRTWMGWDKFIKLTSTIQAKYRHRDINTDTLAREATAIMGYDMFPFFDQWVRDQGIPKIHYSWTAAKEQDGKYLVTIKARQDEAAGFKYLMVPISISFGKGDPVVVTKPFLKPSVEIQLRAPARPEDVRVDEDMTQLADFVRDDGK